MKNKMMRFNLILIVLIIGSSLFGQSYQEMTNTSCPAAWFLTSSVPNNHFVFEKQSTCFRNSFKTYFYYRSNATVSGPVMNISVNNSGTPLNFSYKVFGGYLDQSAGCSAISSGAIPMLINNQSTPIVNQQMQTGLIYILELTIEGCVGELDINVLGSNLDAAYQSESCLSCVSSFMPSTGVYVFSAWVKESRVGTDNINYTRASVKITSGSNSYEFFGKGQIIDGWQRIEDTLQINDAMTSSFELKFNCTSFNDCFFDDVRIYPKDASMVTYVYDPINLRLVSELDERNYAKIYEYDEQGKLIRVKKETAKGIMTIQETRENNAGHD